MQPLWLAFERIVRPLIVRFDDLDIALRIEERWPGLNDRLASTIQFLRMDARDERLGSPALREATVRKAVEETSAIDFREVIELRPVIRGLLAASSALLIATLLVMLAPGTVRIAMKRLFLPLSGTTWPQRTHLVLDDGQTTLKVARGDSFTLSVKVRPGDKVPDSARATYEFADGDRASEPLRSVEGGEFRGRIESVNQPFHFTVTAGDDSSSIRDVPVKVVPPPTLKSLVVRLVSPAYTGIPPQVLAPGLTQLRALEGTKLHLEAIASKPLARAMLNVGEAPLGAGLTFDDSRTGFHAELTVKNNFNFWFDLIDTEGFRNRDAVRYEVRGFSDLAPRVVIDEPKSDRDVPAEATIPVRVVLDDDFGLQSGQMIYRLATGDSEPHEAVDIPLWTAPLPGAGPAVGSFVKHQEVAHDWQLAPLKLPVGTVITFHAEARRFRYDRRPQPRQEPRDSAADHFKEEAARQLDDSRRELRDELARVLTMQKQAITPVDNAIRSLKETTKLPQPQRDDLNNAGMIQRQVGSRLNNRDEGVGARLRRSLEDLQNFKLDNPEAQQQMEGMLARLSVIRDQHLGPAEQGISRAAKSLDQGDAKSPENPPDAAKDATPGHNLTRKRARSLPKARRMPPRSRRGTIPIRVLTKKRARSLPTARRTPTGRPLRPRGAIPRVSSRRIGRKGASRQPISLPGRLLPANRISPAPRRRRSSSPRPRQIRRRSPTSCRRCSTA